MATTRTWALVLLLLTARGGRAQDTTKSCARPAASPFLRTSPNLAPNPAWVGAGGWELAGGASFDGKLSHTPLGGSLRLDAPTARATSVPIPVQSGVLYTLAAYVRTRPWLVQPFLTVELLDRSYRRTNIAQASMQLTTTADAWQEAVVAFTPRPQDAFARIRIGRYPPRPAPGTSFAVGRVWIDDVYFGAGLSFASPPSTKAPFRGRVVQVDGEGNFGRWDGQRFEPFFPLCIYGSPDRLALYSHQGYNCLARGAPTPAVLDAVRAARSPFNPDGMVATLELTQYVTPGARVYADTADLRRRIEAIAASPASSAALAYYWDDEQFDAYDVPRNVTSVVKQADRDRAGHRLRPIYVIEGSQGRARVMGRLADVVGDYVRPAEWRGTVQQSTATRLAIVRSIEGQIAPPTIMVISETRDADELKRLVYDGLIAGARGFAYYRDGLCTADYGRDSTDAGCTDVTRRPSWSVIPELRRTIDRLLPVLREPVGTAWSAMVADRGVTVGTRDHHCDGYVFLLNTRSDTTSAEARIENLPYAAASATDLVSGRTVAVRSGRLTVALPPAGLAVLHLRR